MQIVGRSCEFELRPVSEVPRHVIRQATKESITWDALYWGIVDSEQLALLDRAPIRYINRLFEEWQEDSGITCHEVAQLLNLIEDHSNPLEADLIRQGMRLRDFPSERHNWRDLWVLVTLPMADDKTYAATNPDEAGWDRTRMLLADIADSSNWLQWAKTKEAAEGGEPPARIVRPGVKAPVHRAGSRVKPMTMSRVRELREQDAGGLETSPEERRQKLAQSFR